MNKTLRHWAVALAALALIVGSFAMAQPAAAAATCTQSHSVVRGDNLFRIALRYGTTVAELQRINGMGSTTRIYTGTSLCVRLSETPTGTAYVVQRGDTLARIARRFGVDITVLARVNNITNPNLIYVGATLYIPDVTIQ